MMRPAISLIAADAQGDPRERQSVMRTAEQAQLAMLGGLLRTLLTSVRVRMPRERLGQLCRDIEALARRGGWASAADLTRALATFFSEIDEVEAYGETPTTLIAAIEAAALRPEKDWLPIIMAMRIAIGTAAERQRQRRRTDQQQA